MKMIYITSPYTVGNTRKNVRRQIDAFYELACKGFAPVAPLLGHFVQKHHKLSYHEWLNIDFGLIDHCDGLVRLGGDSPGGDKEVEHARARRIPVFFSIQEVGDYFAGC